MRRLYLQIYFAFLAGLVLTVVLVSMTWLWLTPSDARGLDALASLAGAFLPPSGASPRQIEASLGKLSEKYHVSLELRSPDGDRIAGAGEERLPRPDTSWTRSRFLRSRGRSLTMALRLEDGRWLVLRHRQGAHATAVLLGFLLSVSAVAIVAYPLARRLTGRLERLQARVDALGRGQLESRVEVEGRDEVARLASSFNRAAERIERLVEAQKTLLAGASHELRSPLRIRMAVELIGERAPADLRARIEREIGDLDELIGDLILASRIESRRAIERDDSIDVLALAAEEASRYEASISGSPVEIRGDRALVRRLLRNLLDNARRHAPDSLIEVEVVPANSPGATIRVMDRGSGVAEADRERIFEPFYSSSRATGRGLGLALVRRIAELHGGDAHCIPRPGGGSVFEVSLLDSPS